ncbi:MAG: zinc ABC transporter solute-binding protein [Chloroflexi bacterium]|nr:zinc ABC transporter solute-binding protein [Chloroflexota bacterium]
MRRYIAPAFVLALLILSGCASAQTAKNSAPASADRLKVVATNSIVGDVVAQVGGDAIELTVLIKPGVDPHGYEATPRDAAALADADVLFVNGFGLEEALKSLIDSARAEGKLVVALSEGVPPLSLSSNEGAVDPHTWTDPNNVIIWVNHIEQTLSRLDPNNAEAYADRAEDYRRQLSELDAWIREQTGKIPEPNRKIVSDHAIFGYYARQYGFEQYAITGGFSSLAEPSAQQLAQLEDQIRRLGVPAVFVGNTVNPALAQRVAQDTGAQLYVVYTGSLSKPDGPAGAYLDYMRYNTNTFVRGLSGS